MQTRNFKYDLEEVKINANKYLIFDEYLVSRDGRLTGVNTRTTESGKVVFTHKRRMYYLGKVVLQLFSNDEAVKDFSHINGDLRNCHFNNLVWGLDDRRYDFDMVTTFKGAKFYHLRSMPGYYVSAEGKLLSMRSKRRDKYLLKQRKFDGHPSVTYKDLDGGLSRTCYTHLLVIEAFYGIPYGMTKCIWKDGNRGNVSFNNLQIATLSDVMLNHFKEGRRDPNMFRNALDKIYGKGKRPFGQGRKKK